MHQGRVFLVEHTCCFGEAYTTPCLASWTEINGVSSLHGSGSGSVTARLAGLEVILVERWMTPDGPCSTLLLMEEQSSRNSEELLSMFASGDVSSWKSTNTLPASCGPFHSCSGTWAWTFNAVEGNRRRALRCNWWHDVEWQSSCIARRTLSENS
jgi:hypothetical protein